MYINLRLFFKAEFLGLTRRPFRLRRCGFILFFTGLFGLMWMIVAFGRLLDHILFPGFRKQAIREPIFIIAPPRSGTTFTQKLLSADRERFAFVRLYQTIFPSITLYRLFGALAAVDRLCFRAFSRLAGRVERAFFGGWDDMHRLRFNEPEEDDGFFVYTFVTEAIYLLFPFIEELWEAGFSDALPRSERRRVMRYYRSCLQRHLYAVGPEKTVLSKATQFSGSIEALLEEFPDARIVTLVRNPRESIASHVSVFYPVWHAHSPEIARASPESRAYAGLAAAWFRHIVRCRARVDPRRFHAVRYGDLVRDPVRTVLEIYAHFGLEPSGEFRVRLAAAGRAAGGYRSRHRYSLEEFGLDDAWIEEQLGDVLDAWDLRPRREEAVGRQPSTGSCPLLFNSTAKHG